jgi:hypothetical protein
VRDGGEEELLDWGIGWEMFARQFADVVDVELEIVQIEQMDHEIRIRNIIC